MSATEEETLRARLSVLDEAVLDNLGSVALLNALAEKVAAQAETINVRKHEAALAREVIERERVELHDALAKLAP